MYERLGDLERLCIGSRALCIAGCGGSGTSGAIVKPFGDAVMAVFSRPTDAISAALG